MSKITTNSGDYALNEARECAIKEQGRKVVEHPTASNQKRTLGGSQMAENANSGILSQESNPDNWKSIGELARNLAEKAGGAK